MFYIEEHARRPQVYVISSRLSQPPHAPHCVEKDVLDCLDPSISCRLKQIYGEVRLSNGGNAFLNNGLQFLQNFDLKRQRHTLLDGDRLLRINIAGIECTDYCT